MPVVTLAEQTEKNKKKNKKNMKNLQNATFTPKRADKAKRSKRRKDEEDDVEEMDDEDENDAAHESKSLAALIKRKKGGLDDLVARLAAKHGTAIDPEPDDDEFMRIQTEMLSRNKKQNRK
jgi:hypothetical protein